MNSSILVFELSKFQKLIPQSINSSFQCFVQQCTSSCSHLKLLLWNWMSSNLMPAVLIFTCQRTLAKEVTYSMSMPYLSMLNVLQLCVICVCKHVILECLSCRSINKKKMCHMFARCVFKCDFFASRLYVCNTWDDLLRLESCDSHLSEQGYSTLRFHCAQGCWSGRSGSPLIGNPSQIDSLCPIQFTKLQDTRAVHQIIILLLN